MNAKTFFSDRPIAYHPSIAKACGSVTAALFLSQIAYWSDKGNDESGWIWKTQEEMTEETGLSRSEQETARKTLVRLNVLKEERRGVPARMWYLIDWDALDDLIENAPQTSYRKPAIKKPKTCNQDAAKPANYSEITSESTTESTPISSAPQTENVSMDQEAFKAVFTSIESAMPHSLNRHECETIRDLWNERPDLDAHHYAFLQTVERADGFNLRYYESCLEGYHGNTRQLSFIEAAAARLSRGGP